MDARYDHSLVENQLKKDWHEQGTYTIENNPGPLYTIDTPPPTVSGSLHIGHIFSYTQTDIIARYKRMHGYAIFYPMGFDDNGLATERFVENRRNIKGYQLPRSEFIKICLEESHAAEEIFKELWQRLGLSIDWKYTYSTISDRSRALSQESFITLYNNGFIYRRQEPALYCTTCRTSVAQAELDDKEVPSQFNDIIFKDSNENDLIIGTTRPELLPSCVALLYNPQDERYKHLAGTYATVPLYDYSVPIYADEDVAIEKGTGLVMCCTFGDKMDITWYKKYNLPYKQSVGLDGKWLEHTGILAGLKAIDARAKILEALAQQNLLIRQQSIVHNVSIHERCKKEIEFISLPQWFVNILDYKKEFLALADAIEWYPTFMKVRYLNWVENLNWDWCISRQRFFGIPFPVWHCNDCGHIIVAEISQLPVDPQEYSYTKPCAQCNGTNIDPDTDVMDTWNTSSISPYICADLYQKSTKSPFGDNDAFIPMSMRPQAHDIIRTWAFYTIVKSWMHNRTYPWSSIVISGHVQTSQKEKISKSQGNTPTAPDALLSRYPADAIRYWTAQGTLGYDSPFSEEQIKNGQRLITKLWNAFRFAQPHIVDAPSAQPASLGVVNEWILDAAATCFKQYDEYFKRNEFGHALLVVDAFFWKDYCDNYIELIKNQLFNPQEYDQNDVEATKWTLHTIGIMILQWYAPYVPYITDAIYQALYQTRIHVPSIHQTKFSLMQQSRSYTDSRRIMKSILVIVETMRKLKSDHKISLKVPINVLHIYSTESSQRDDIAPHEQLIRGVTHAQHIEYSTNVIDSSYMEATEQERFAHIKI